MRRISQTIRATSGVICWRLIDFYIFRSFTYNNLRMILNNELENCLKYFYTGRNVHCGLFECFRNRKSDLIHRIRRNSSCNEPKNNAKRSSYFSIIFFSSGLLVLRSRPIRQWYSNDARLQTWDFLDYLLEIYFALFYICKSSINQIFKKWSVSCCRFCSYVLSCLAMKRTKRVQDLLNLLGRWP